MKKQVLILMGSLAVAGLSAQRENNDHSQGDEAIRQMQRADGAASHIVELPGDVQRKHFRPFLPDPRRVLKASGEIMVLDSMTGASWDEDAYAWETVYRAYYTMNDRGLITEYRDADWNSSSGTWEDDDLETYEYNEQGELLLYTDFNLDEEGSGWYSAWKREYLYQDGRLTEHREYQKDEPGEEFYPVWWTVFMYDDEDRVTGTMEYINTFGWKETWRTEYSYDPIGNLVTFIDYDDNESEPSGWEYAWKEEYTYDDRGNLELYEEFEWDEANDAWMNSDREEYTVSVAGDLESATDFYWSEDGENWEISWRDEYSYDPAVPYEDLHLPWFFHDDIPNYFNHLMTGYTNYFYEDGEWERNYRARYHFSGTGITSQRPGEYNGGVLLYPNPVASMLYFRADGIKPEKVELYDLTGKQVLSERLNGLRSLDISELGQGVYFCRVTGPAGRMIASQKILVSGD